MISHWRIILNFFSGTIAVSSHLTFIGSSLLPLFLRNDFSLTNNIKFFFGGNHCIQPSDLHRLCPLPLLLTSDCSLTNNNNFFFRDNHYIQPSDLRRICHLPLLITSDCSLTNNNNFFFGDNHCIQPSDLRRLFPPTALANKWFLPDE
jgi:hypothetical protein